MVQCKLMNCFQLLRPGFDMHNNLSQVRHLVKQIVTQLFGDVMALDRRQVRFHGNVNLGSEAMPHPTLSQPAQFLHLRLLLRNHLGAL